MTSENKKIRDNSCVEALFILGELKQGRLIAENMSATERQNIFDFLDLVYANFISRIKADFDLTKGELLLAALIKLGFSNQQLMIVFDCEMKSVYKNKQRLKSHLLLRKDDALEQMIVVVEKPEHHSIDVNKSFNIENEINNYRNQLKNQNILDVNNKEYDYQMGVYYMDIIAECEKLGDYVVNVVEASSDVKEKKLT